MGGYAPRAREESMRPRRLVGASGRPLNFTVRFRMRQPLTLALAFIVALGFGGALGQTETHVRIRVLSDDTCLVYEVPVPCRDVGARLRELGTPSDVNIHVSAENGAKYEAVVATLDSLKRAGFKAKVGYIVVH